MKTSTAEINDFVCPNCKDTLTRDRAGRGFVRHKSNPDCYFEKGEKDELTHIRATLAQNPLKI